MSSPSIIGLVVGLVVGLVLAFGGFLELLIVVVCAAVGLIIGRVVEGKLSVRDLFGSYSGRE